MTKKTLEIAIVGVGAIYAGARNATEFWKEIKDGKDLITDVPPSHWSINDYYDKNPKARDKTYCRRGSFLPYVEFDPIEWGIQPQVIPVTDTSQLLALIVAKEVLNDTYKGSFFNVDLTRASVILGVTTTLDLLTLMTSRLIHPVWIKALREHGISEDQINSICDRIASRIQPWEANTFPGLLMNVVAGRIANRLNFGGTNCITDAACASSLAAFSMGINELRLHESDLVVAGGVDALNDIFAYMCFSKTPALSPNEECRPFSAQSDGTLLGEGIGLFALKRLEDAEKDNNQIYAVIRGIGSSSDGRSKSIYAPVAKGQAVAMERTYIMAGYSPRTVELIEAHGTGTKAGDIEEFISIKEVFENADKQHKQWCALGTIKSQLGHTKGAAGAAGLFKIVMALHHQVIPPTIKIDKPHPDLHIEDSPFYLNTIARPWIKNPKEPRRASVSSFGFGGTNFHITVEEYQGKNQAYRLDTRDNYLILFSAKDNQELIEKCVTAMQESEKFDDFYVPFFADDSCRNFNYRDQVRLGLIVTGKADFNDKINQIIKELKSNEIPKNQDIFFSNESQTRKLAFLFADQGGEYLGMGADIAMSFKESREIWDITTEIPLESDIPLHEVVFPKAVFSEAEKEQQLNRLKNSRWSQPSLAALSFSQLKLLNKANLKPEMVSGQGLGEIIALSYANAFDFPTLIRITSKRGELMADSSIKQSSSQFRHFLNEVPFQEFNKLFYSTIASQDQNSIKDAIANGLEKPSPLDEVICVMHEKGINTFLEIGAGTVLSNVVRSILPEKEIQVIAMDNKNEKGLTTCWRVFGQLAVLGYAIDFEKLIADYRASTIPEKIENKKNRILINGANIKPKVEDLKPEKISQPIPEEKNTQLYEQIENEIVKAHELYQKSVTDSHMAFLHVMEEMLHPSQDQPNPISVVEHIEKQKPTVVEEKEVEEKKLDTEAEQQKPKQIQQTSTTMILSIISEETGYPVDMLNMDMEMEADLGIDSIKRVEILSAIKNKLPDLPDIDPSKLASLKTLRQLKDFIIGPELSNTESMVQEKLPSSSPVVQVSRIAQQLKIKPLPGQPLPNLHAGLISIVNDKKGLAKTLANILNDAGLKTKIINDISAYSESSRCVIFLENNNNITASSVMDTNLEAFHIATTLAASFSTSGGTLVMVQFTNGGFGLADANVRNAWSAGLVALGRTARLEWPKTFIKNIDIDLTNKNLVETANLIANELLEGGNDNEIGLASDGSRFIIADYMPVSTTFESLKLTDGAIVLVSGGGRGVTAWCLEALAAHHRLHFILLGRTILVDEPEYCKNAKTAEELKHTLYEHAKSQQQTVTPKELTQRIAGILATRDILQTVNELKAKGSNATYYSVDVTDQARLQEIITDVRKKYGKISGLIHGAGVIQDRLILEKTQEQFAQVFQPKVIGLFNLLEALSSDQLELLVLFSSVVARYGNKGQCDYAMANQILNTVAAAEQQRRGPTCLVKSLGWGPWEGGMVTPELQKQFQERGITLLSRKQGTELFISELSQRSPVTIVLGGSLHDTHDIKESQEVITITSQDYAFLHSHVIKGSPVVPVCLVIEWFIRHIRKYYSNINVAAFTNLKVLHGLRLEKLNQQPYQVTLAVTPVQDGNELSLSLSIQEHPSYIMTVTLHPTASKNSLTISEETMAKWPWNVEDCYGKPDKLFHGPAFHVIKSLDQYGDKTATATLHGILGTNDESWPGHEWATDPGIVDGAFQIAVLFGLQFLGKITLPMKIGELQIHQYGLIKDPVRCVITKLSHDRYHAIYNIILKHMDDSPIMDIKNLEMVVVP